MPEIKRLVVTGGAGFVGSNFVRWFLMHLWGHVTVLDKLTYAGNLANLEGLSADRFTFVKGDIRDTDLAAKLFPKPMPACILPRKVIMTIRLRIPRRLSRRMWKARIPFWKRYVKPASVFTISRRTRCLGIRLWIPRRGLRKIRPIGLRVPTVPRKRRPTCWCGRGCGLTASAPRFPTAPISTVPDNTWRNSFRGRLQTS